MTSRSPQPYIILLVDDNEPLLAGMKFALDLRGYTVLTATNGIDGLELMLTKRPDCVVLDVKMAELSGHDVVKILRGDPDTASIPVVMLSALQQDKEVFAGQASGADYYLVKPVQIAHLVETVHHAIALGAKERAERVQSLLSRSGSVFVQDERAVWSGLDGDDQSERIPDYQNRDPNAPWSTGR